VSWPGLVFDGEVPVVSVLWKGASFEIMEGSGERHRCRLLRRKSRRWGSKTGVRIGRGALLSMALLMRDQSLAN
jgi:hypothetical protein